MKLYFFILSLLFCSVIQAQNTITGSVTDSKKQPVLGANIRVIGDSSGTTTDSDGNFKLSSAMSLPFKLEITAIGFEKKSATVSSNNQKISFVLNDEETKLNEIVVSASRTPERVIESPVTIERMGLQQIKSSTAATYYDGLENLKEVHFNTSSLSFKSINTRGFATVANTRFMQLVDGMDNSSPALNFVLGNLIGLSELDVANVELLPGASSALYGANAFNGILFMNSKSPFTSEGISTYMKYGQSSQKTAGTNDYYDFGIRAAHAFNKYIAAKANLNIMKATEWIASDTRDVNGGLVGHENNQNYNGLNYYGDEATVFIPNVGNVSRTGYRDQDLNDNKIKSVKADFSLHFRPWANDFEIILQSKVGAGNTIYQGANRYALKSFFMNQNKIEVKANNFFVRGYVVAEDAGNSYNMTFAGLKVNEEWKSNTNWFTDYATAYQLSSAVLGFNAANASNYARNFADLNLTPLLPLTPSNLGGARGTRLLPGTSAFDAALAKVIGNSNPITGGAKFEDRSRIYHSDANYNFKDKIKFGEIQVGSSYRIYEMNSNGSIFTDKDGKITYNEIGFYSQLTKKFLKEGRLKFTGSLRYDKSQNFDGFVSPRVAFVYSAGANKKHNFRLSYQTGFRNPTTQDQYIGLDVGPYALIGSAPDNLARYSEIRGDNFNGSGVISAAGQAILGASTKVMTGLDAYNNSFTKNSIIDFDNAISAGQTPAAAAANLQVASIGLVKPERVQAIELGYRSVINNDLSIDINGYYSIYNDFINQARVFAPYYGDVNQIATNPNAITAIANKDRREYNVYTNSQTQVTSVGFGIGLAKKVYKDFEVSVNYNYADFTFDQEKDPSFIAGFNTPKHRVKGSLGNDKLFKNFGFNTNVRWNTEYLWESNFGDGMVPENTVFDAQINYAIPALKSVLKVGGNNVFGKDYIQVIGAGSIGQLWYASWTINP
jgi:outer membrane receptor protein involved in Fe transport